ncbi:hypothetical protein TWF225_006890 [Orbilia oligospora]|nr:hypothetical protein TWF225_006890 [Orbilia oligospora]KAF3246238.1 hypothetical protein TWF128_009045 [Orbilia oligospora]KAF3264094.1 hypothetical protein TWF217_003251 [Orbilia oligospora]KAF3296157.1 hypothetical protein TWF132_011620 [Orbilia oligospora]
MLIHDIQLSIDPSVCIWIRSWDIYIFLHATGRLPQFSVKLKGCTPTNLPWVETSRTPNLPVNKWWVLTLVVSLGPSTPYSDFKIGWQDRANLGVLSVEKYPL